MNPQRTSYNAEPPVFQHDKTLQLLTGGFVLLVAGFPTGAILRMGTAILVDEIARTATPVKSAKVTKAVVTADTTVEVAKGHYLIAGDKINGKAIESVDTTNATHDVLTLAAGYGKAEAVGNLIGSGDGNALLYNSIKVVQGNTHPVEAVVGGLVYARRIGFISDKTKAATPNIIYSQTK